MHLVRCIAVSAKGGFKINGPPKNGKGPVSNEKEQDTSTEASLPQPTRAGRIETCMELIRQAMRCLENNDKECIIKTLEELIKSGCHDGRLIGVEIVDKVREIIHELWLRSDYELRCKLLVRLVVELGVSRNWFRSVFNTNTKMLNKWLGRCDIDWEGRATRYNVAENIEKLLRDKLGWDEVRMCEEMWKYIGIDISAFKRHGVEPCNWLTGLKLLSDLRRPYWLGLARSDMIVRRHRNGIELRLKTTNSIDAVFFPALLDAVKAPSLRIECGKEAPAAKYVSESINLAYYIILSADAWPWPIKLNADELERIIKGFTDEELAMFIAALLDGDGTIWYSRKSVYVVIAACKYCPKRFILNMLREAIARRFGIIGDIYSKTYTDALMFSSRDAVRLLRFIIPYLHHPLRRLRAELILAYYGRRISRKAFRRLYNMTKYKRGESDVKRNNGLEALAQVAPQTHTHRKPNANRRT